MRVSALLLALALLVSMASAQGTDGFSALFYNIYTNRTLDAGSFIEAKNFPLIDFTGTNAATMWGMSSTFPAHYVGAKFFGNFTPPVTATYTFQVITDDGCRLSIGGKLLIDSWKDQAATTYQADIALTANTPVLIQYDFYEWGGNLRLLLAWWVGSQTGGQYPRQLVAAPYVKTTAVANVNFITYNGIRFAVLDGSSYTTAAQGCQTKNIALPAGWSIATNGNTAAAVIASYRWGTSCIAVSNGLSYRTFSAALTPCTVPIQIVGSPTAYNVSACGRILISQAVGSSDVDLALAPTPSNIVTYNSIDYAVMENSVPQSSLNPGVTGCQNVHYRIPSGWNIAPDDTPALQVIVGNRHTWGTNCVVLNNGNARNTITGALCNSSQLTTLSANGFTLYGVVSCPARVLLFKTGSSRAASWTSLTSLTNFATIGGLQFATFQNNAPIDNSVGCHDVALTLPTGWSLAIFSPSALGAIAAASFGTSCLTLADGIGYDRSGSVCARSNLIVAGTQYATASCPTRVLLQRAAPTASPCGTCYGWGDPHYKTYLGNGFNYFGSGEYVLSADPSNAYRVHGFTYPFRTVSMHVRMAAQYRLANGTTDKVEVIAVPEGVAPPFVRVNGVNVTLSAGSRINMTTGAFLQQVGTYRIKDNTGQRTSDRLTYIFTMPNGVVVTAYIGWYQVNLMDIYVQMPNLYKGLAVGMCGSCDATVGDFRLPNTTRLPSFSVPWADSWRVPTNQSLFTDILPPTPTPVPISYTANFSSNNLKAAADTACGSIVDAEAREACKFDVAVTEDTTIATTSSTTESVTRATTTATTTCTLVAINNTFVKSGITYALLDNTSPAATDVGCQSLPLGIPAGWAIAEDLPAVRAAIPCQTWGTTCLVLRNGNGYTRSLTSCGTAQLSTSLAGGATCYLPAKCNSRILLVQLPTFAVLNPSFSSSNGTTADSWAQGGFGYTLSTDTYDRLPGANSIQVALTAAQVSSNQFAAAEQVVSYTSAAPFSVAVWSKVPAAFPATATAVTYCLVVEVTYGTTPDPAVSSCFSGTNTAWAQRSVDVIPRAAPTSVRVRLVLGNVASAALFSTLTVQSLRGTGANLVANADISLLAQDPWLNYKNGANFSSESATPLDGTGSFVVTAPAASAGQCYGRVQYLTTVPANTYAVWFGGWSKASPADLNALPSYNYSIYLDIRFTDDTWYYGRFTAFSSGAHDWEYKDAFAYLPRDKQVKQINVYGLVCNMAGTFSFDNIFVYPVCDASGFVQPGLSFGDPHFVSFDGLKFDLQSTGDFVLFQDSFSGIETHVRTEAAAAASVISGIAVRTNNTFELLRGTNNDLPTFLFNGLPTLLDVNGLNEFPDCHVSVKNADTFAVRQPVTYELQFTAGAFLSVTVFTNSFGRQWMQLSSYLTPASRGLTVGLLGNFDGFTNNDLTDSRTARAINPATLTNTQLYSLFGDSWRVPLGREIFSDLPGAVSSAIPSLDDFTAAEIATAQEFCANISSSQALIDACVLDYLLSGDQEIAASVAAVETSSAQLLSLSSVSNGGVTPTTKKHKSSSKAWIAGVVIGALLLVGIIGFFCWRHARKD